MFGWSVQNNKKTEKRKEMDQKDNNILVRIILDNMRDTIS